MNAYNTMKQTSPDWSALDRAEKNLATIRASLDRLAADNQRHKLALDRVAVRVVSPWSRLWLCRWF